MLCALGVRPAHAGTWQLVSRGLDSTPARATALAKYRPGTAGGFYQIPPNGQVNTVSSTLTWKWIPAAGETTPPASSVGVIQKVQVANPTANAQATAGGNCSVSVSASPPGATVSADATPTKNSATNSIPAGSYSKIIDYKSASFSLSQDATGQTFLNCTVSATAAAGVSGVWALRGLLLGYVGPIDGAGTSATTGVTVATTSATVDFILRAE